MACEDEDGEPGRCSVFGVMVVHRISLVDMLHPMSVSAAVDTIYDRTNSSMLLMQFVFLAL